MGRRATAAGRLLLCGAFLCGPLSVPVRAQVSVPPTPAMESVGQVREMLAPDRAGIALRIEATGATAEAASRSLAAKVNRVLGVVTAAGIAEADTESDGPTVQELYETVRDERGREQIEKRRRTGYSAAYGLTLTTSNLAGLPELLPRLSEAEGLVSGVEFSLSDARSRLLALEERAVKDALERAGRLIAASGARPGRILAIAIPGDEGMDMRRAGRPMKAAAPAADREIRLPIRPGRITIEARVSVTVEIVAP
ncbi:SIMPL domain-containing protein [Methylobacterium sp. Leaf399]|uniref:SIMPL domain-containing protein n=1 Tax=Methylobacterium sp. Leaf399 TaxID=1736364 RepID=UPI000A97B103|nr:SIMPL domain-containing protein [Methylobacterium sp. Leaf399]